MESLVGSSFTGGTDDETSRWLADLEDRYYAKLATVGLVKPRAQTSTKLGEFLERFRADRVDVKAGTQMVYGHTVRCLVEHFGANKPLREVTAGDAKAFRLFLVKQDLAENTIRRRIGIARQFFRAAMRQELISKNPFDGMAGCVIPYRSRFFFITREMADKVMEACPDLQWRLLFALSRYGGLRCPSEHLGLKWSDIDWEHNRITVHSPKTEHHAGGDLRILPLFPELHSLLLEAFTQAEPGEEFVITRYRCTNQSLRTQLERIITKAGLKTWPKLFQNLRSSRETELCERFPEHVVCAWIGNSQTVARKHYLQVTDEHYEQASMKKEEGGAQAAQNPAQQPAEVGRNDPKTETERTPQSPDIQDIAAICDTLHNGKLGVTTRISRKVRISQ